MLIKYETDRIASIIICFTFKLALRRYIYRKTLVGMNKNEHEKILNFLEYILHFVRIKIVTTYSFIITHSTYEIMVVDTPSQREYTHVR